MMPAQCMIASIPRLLESGEVAEAPRKKRAWSGNDESWMNPKFAIRAPSERADAEPGGAAWRRRGPAQMGNALEALRIATTFFVLFYHASLSYLATPMRLTLWASYDASGHVAFDYFVYWVNGFAMPVFFLAAGVSAPAACASRGPRVFLTSRVRRLLRPLLFACLTILPFFYLVWGYALLVTGGLALDDILRWRFSPRGFSRALWPGALLVPRVSLPGQRALVWRLDAAELPVPRAAGEGEGEAHPGSRGMGGSSGSSVRRGGRSCSRFRPA